MDKTIRPEELREQIVAEKTMTLIDVRRKEDYEKSPDGIGDAQWQDPAAIDQWIQTVPKDKEVVIYCVRGGSVSQSVQKQLTEAGIKARYLEGGIEAFNSKS